mmetsp:Transcript_25186/g.57932  ORF Transcript_25186/g.57932 Transcript_25186/m.57932 type:complete len:475 (+) Transcript_25186:53-1477(+)
MGKRRAKGGHEAADDLSIATRQADILDGLQVPPPHNGIEAEDVTGCRKNSGLAIDLTLNDEQFAEQMLQDSAAASTGASSTFAGGEAIESGLEDNQGYQVAEKESDILDLSNHAPDDALQFRLEQIEADGMLHSIVAESQPEIASAEEAPRLGPLDLMDAELALEFAMEAGGDSPEPRMKSITVQPGLLGITLHNATGLVDQVSAGSQCAVAGVEVGWRALSVNGSRYSQELLATLSQGDAPYSIKFSIGEVASCTTGCTSQTPEKYWMSPRAQLAHAAAVGVWHERVESKTHQALLWLQDNGTWFHRAHREVQVASRLAAEVWELAECLGSWQIVSTGIGNAANAIELTIEGTRWTSNGVTSQVALRPLSEDRELIDKLCGTQELKVQYSLAIGGRSLLRVMDFKAKHLEQEEMQATVLLSLRSLGFEACYRRADQDEGIRLRNDQRSPNTPEHELHAAVVHPDLSADPCAIS